MSTRRAFLGLGAVALGYVALRSGGPALWARLGPLPKFSTEGMPDGFRKREGAAEMTAGISNPLIGLDDGETEVVPALEGAALCDAVFGQGDPSRVTLNYFTDYNCPYCRVLGRDLKDFVARMPDMAELIYHELPLLGLSSVLGAHAALAARKQSAYDLMHERLNTGVVRINQGYIEALAAEFGLDRQQLLSDMSSPEIDATLRRSKGIANAFGVIGTPFLLVGRTAVYGKIGAPQLAKLIKDEAGRLNDAGCRAA